MRQAAGPVPCPVMTGDGFVPATFDPPTSLVTRRVPPRAVGAAAQPRRSCRLDIEHRAHPLHSRLPRRQLAPPAGLTLEETWPTCAATPRSSPDTQGSPSPSSTQSTTTSSGARTCTPRPRRRGTSRCSTGYGPTGPISTAHWPTPWRAGSPPTGTGSGSTAVVADHHACSADATIEHVDGAEKAHRSRRCPRRESAESAAPGGGVHKAVGTALRLQDSL